MKKVGLSGWNLWKFIKGRRRMALTAVAGLLGLLLSDSALIAGLSGAIVEAGFAVAEFYYKK